MADNDPLDQLKQATAALRGQTSSGSRANASDSEPLATDSQSSSPLDRLRQATASVKKATGQSNHVPGKVVPFSGPTAISSPTEAAAKVGRPMIKLAPPAADITQVPRNVFTGGARIPGMPTQEEIAANGTVGPQPDVTLPGPHGTPIKLKQSDIETAGKVFLPGMNPDATLQGNAPIVSPERGIVAPQNLMTETEQKQHPILTGLGQLGEGLTTPENLAILAGTAGFGELPAAARAGLSAYFAAQMAEGAAGNYVDGWKAYKRGDTGEAKRLWTMAAGSAVMGGAAGAHAIRETPFAPKVGAEPVVPKGTISEPLARDAAITPERAAQIGSESVKPPKPPAGAIGPKEEPLAPEKPETLKAQVEALKKGTNKTVYFPKGTENLPAPPGNAVVTVVPGEKAGAGTWYHAKDVKPILILKKVQDGTFGELLGNHQSKQVALAGESPTAIVARDPGGTEVKASLVDGSKPDVVAAQAATLQRQFPKSEISVEKPEDVIHERLGTTPKEPEKVAAAPVSGETPITERRSQVRDLGGPDFMRTTRLNQLRTELADKSLPAEDRVVMQRQYDDMVAHPFEKHEGGDINQMKAAAKPTLTRAEAETATEQRKAGRNKRFGIPGSAAGATADIQPRIAEIGPEFHDLATKVDQIDPSLAKDLRAVANGEIHKPEHLEAIAGRVKDADTKAELTKAAQDYRAASSTGRATSEAPGKANESQAASVLAIHGQAEAVREAAPQNRRKLGIPGRKAKKFSNDELLAEAYRPGNVVGSYGGQHDKVLEFIPGDESKPYPHNSWIVKVIASDKAGNVKPGEDVRAHHTMPEKADLLAAQKRLEAKAAVPKHSPEVLDQARHEIRAASELASSFERPGRYFAEHGDQNEGMPSRSTNAAKGIHAGGTWYGVSSSKHIVADQYPWFEKMKGAGGKLAELAGKEKGAEYDRLVNTVAEHILRERESAAPVVAEFAPKLKSLSDEIDGHDEELSSTLAELAKGDGRGFKNLREYIEKKVNDAEQARDFYRLIDAAAKEAREASVEEPAGSGTGLRAEEGKHATEGTEANATEGPAANSEFLKAENVKKQPPAEKQNALPGFESALEQLKAATETVRGEKLTEEANRPLGNIDNASGEMERNSPLFRGTAASPQNEMFEGPTAAVGDRVQVNGGPLEGKSVEVTKVGDSGVYVRGEDGPVKFVKNGDFEAAPKAEVPKPSLFNTAHANPVFDPEVWKSVLGYLEPSPAAGQADLRARTGELARKQAVLQEKLKAERNRWRGRSDADMLAFADLVENGEADRKARGVTLNPKTQTLLDRGKKSIGAADKNLAATLRTLLDEGRTAVQDLGTGKLQNFIENYFPHIWEEKNKVGAAFGRVFGKRPLEGPRSFLKKREIPTTAEGFDRDLKPVTSNPVDMAIVKMHEMNRYVMAHRLLDDLKAAKTAQFVGFAEKPPEGWKPLDDKVFTVYGNPDIPVKEYYDEAVWDKLKTLADNLGIKHERAVNIGGTRLGYTAKGTDKVVTRFAGPEQVIAHEIGHQMDWKYGLKGQLIKTSPYREELRKLVDLKWEGKEAQNVPESFRKYIRKGEEKMAGMIEALVHAPDKFKQVAPQTYSFLKKFIADKPELQPLMDVKPSMKIGVRSSTVNAGGMVIHGRYYAPEEVATPINRYVSTGLKGIPIYDIVRGFGNSLNQLQLGLSGFHLGTTSLNAVMSQFALGVKQASRGEVFKAAKNILAAPSAPIRNMIQGHNIAKDYLRPDQAKKYAATAKAIEQAGGRIGMGEEYIDNRIEKMLQSFANKKYFTGILQSIPAAVEAQAIPVLKWTVPRMKLGAFHDLASDTMARGQKEGWNQEKIRSELQKSWDSIDNRFGQVVYDNLNWNRMTKDLAFIAVRSVGWNHGTWRELLGGVKDVATQAGAALNGKGFNVTDRMAYTFALPVTIASLGALYMYAHTGKWPQSAKDYFYPKNGKVEEDSTEARASMPSYMKDVFAVSEHPVDTALHKMNPAIAVMIEMLENKDYYGNEIRNSDDPAVQQIGQALSHVAKSYLPFTLRNAQKQAQIGQKGVIPKLENYMGITPAPRNVERTDAEALAHDLLQRRSPSGAHTTAEQQKRERIFQLEQEVRNKTLTREALKKKLDSGEVTEQEAITAIKRSQTPGLMRAFKQLSIPEALKVWDVAMPKEREQLKEILAAKVQSGFPKMTREDQERYRPLLRRALAGLPTRSSTGIPMGAPSQIQSSPMQ